MAAKRKNYDEAVKMYNSGMSIQDCADYYNITRQAMWMILKRRGCEFRKQTRYGEENNFYRGGKSASERAHDLIEKAVKKGKIIPKPCEICGNISKMSDGRLNVQAHHDDYNKPMEVRWLCQKHHYEWHKKNNAIQLEQGEEGELAGETVTVISGGFP